LNRLAVEHCLNELVVAWRAAGTVDREGAQDYGGHVELIGIDAAEFSASLVTP
jgi:hypothetical protein